MLICEWEPERSLEKRKALAFYGLPKEGHVIFLYDKAWFRTVKALRLCRPLRLALLTGCLCAGRARPCSDDDVITSASCRSTAPNTRTVPRWKVGLLTHAFTHGSACVHYKSRPQRLRKNVLSSHALIARD